MAGSKAYGDFAKWPTIMTFGVERFERGKVARWVYEILARAFTGCAFCRASATLLWRITTHYVECTGGSGACTVDTRSPAGIRDGERKARNLRVSTFGPICPASTFRPLNAPPSPRFAVEYWLPPLDRRIAASSPSYFFQQPTFEKKIPQ